MRATILAGIGMALALCFPRGGVAKIDLVTLPARDETQITIYNGEDITLARESRTVTFQKGLNRIQFSWANTLIDPTSPQLFFKDRPDAFTIQDITYPANTQNLLQWNVEAEESGPAQIEITYFLSGVNWKADYVVKSNPDETKATIESYVRVTNQSGEDFENTQTRLLVGSVNLVEKIADLARRGIISHLWFEGVAVGDRSGRKDEKTMLLFDAVAPSGGVNRFSYAREMDEIKEVIKQAVSEYQLYTIEGTEDIPNGWSKRLRSFAAEDVKIEVAYESNPEKYGPEVVKLYKTKNDTEHKLGKDPLPEGVYRALREDGTGGLVWAGRDEQKYIPIGEKIDLNLGPDGLVTIEDRAMDFERLAFEFDEHKNITGWDERSTMRIEVRNSKSTAAPVKITRTIDGNWDLEPGVDAKDVKYTKKDLRTVEFETTVEPFGIRKIEYSITIHEGTRSGDGSAEAK